MTDKVLPKLGILSSVLAEKDGFQHLALYAFDEDYRGPSWAATEGRINLDDLKCN